MLLLRIERYLKARKMAPTRFGRNAVGDPWLVPHMRNGRVLRDRTAARVTAYLDEAEVELKREQVAAGQANLTSMV